MQLEITKKILIMKDFPVFIDYLLENKIQLTRTKENLKGTTLSELNQLMSYSVPNTNKRNRQRIYPVLHLFYHLSLEGRLFEKVKDGSKIFLRPTERLEQYQELTLTEKYFFLLETFWVDCDWDKLQESNLGSNPLGQVYYVVEELNQEFIGRKINLRDTRLRLFGWGYFLVYLEYFGFWEVTYKEADSKTTYLAKTIKINRFGYTMLNLLVKNRDLDLWNLPQRRRLGDFKGRPGASLTIEQEDDLLDELFFMLGLGADLPPKEEVLTEIERENDKDENQEVKGEDQAEEEFIAAFKSYFPVDTLNNTLS